MRLPERDPLVTAARDPLTVPFRPISLWQKGGVGIALATMSWAMFLAGSALAGKKGVAYLKRRLFLQSAPA